MSHRNSFVENLTTFRSKERAEFEDSIRRAEQEKAEAPLREAERQFQATAKELGSVMRETVLSGPDPEFCLPTSVSGKRMSFDAAKKFNGEQAALFRETCEEFRQWNTPENVQAIIDYVLRQGVCIADAETFKRGFLRLRDLGLLTERAVEQQNEPGIQPVAEEQPQPEQKPKYVGVDGREYSEREVFLMSSTEMKRVFGLYGTNLPTIEKALSGA